MAYYPLNLIEHPHFNDRQILLDNVWDVGSGNSGYGQPYSDVVAAGDLIEADIWAIMCGIITSMSNHQVPDDLLVNLITPQVDDKVAVIAYLDIMLDIITANRLNAQYQGNTVNYTSTSTSSWSNKLEYTWTIQFSSYDAARYYFNAGGQVGIWANHPWSGGYTINQQINDLCRDTGRIWLSSPVGAETAILAGTAFYGVTKIDLDPGDIDGTTILNPGNGFHSLTSSFSTLITQQSSFVYNAFWGGSYAGSKVDVLASCDNTGALVIKYIIDEVPDGASVTSGTTCYLDMRYPSNQHLPISSWGTPTVTPVITY